MRMVAAIALVCLAACSREPDPVPEPPPEPVPETRATGVVAGKTVFKGRWRVKKERIPTPKCKAMHPDGPPNREDVILNEAGSLRNVLVHVRRVKGSFRTPKEPLLIDQKKCIYTPHVLAVIRGQPLQIRNSDAVLHTVRIAAKKNPSANFGMDGVQTLDLDPLQVPEIGIEVVCDIHTWMKSYIHVLSHSKFDLTGDGGRFRIEGLPAGTHTLVAWHERFGEQTREITLKEGQILDGIEFVFTK